MERHGKNGHLNVCVLDQDDIVTSYGKHARVVAFHPDHEGLYVRVDLPAMVRRHDPTYPALPEPTIDQILSVARNDQGAPGRWRLRSREMFSHGGSIEFRFDRA